MIGDFTAQKGGSRGKSLQRQTAAKRGPVAVSELSLIKTQFGYQPCTDQDMDLTNNHKMGDVIRADFKKMRNPKFHRKFFALLNIGFAAWEPVQVHSRHGEIEKNFDQFREDVTILAGYYEQHHRLDGTFRVRAKSIKFGSMGEAEFTKLYSAVIDVLLKRVLTQYKGREELDRVVDQVLGFA